MKTTYELGNAVFLTGVPVTDINTQLLDGHIIAAGPITKQPGSQANRVILANTGSHFVVWRQYFPNWTLEQLDTTNSEFETGNYFNPDQLSEATAMFAERLADTTACIKSIYREAA